MTIIIKTHSSSISHQTQPHYLHKITSFCGKVFCVLCANVPAGTQSNSKPYSSNSGRLPQLRTSSTVTLKRECTGVRFVELIASGVTSCLEFVIKRCQCGICINLIRDTPTSLNMEFGITLRWERDNLNMWFWVHYLKCGTRANRGWEWPYGIWGNFNVGYG